MGQLSWFAAPCLFAQCYIYRLVYIFFSRSTPFWKAYDISFTDKRDPLTASYVATFELIKRFHTILAALRQDDSHLTDEETQKALLDEII
ncbi:hypothetical protein GJ744_011097 [Endocarpon pusillum]|uniref:Uncharacterized protein n=1 Tax=Endocarpon pusillum TaxID=364733 RepID=A0A8H7E513_9EURO|nr:hypothetical protein GJ744_011097 [Endocarpon pusillum]